MTDNSLPTVLVVTLLAFHFCLFGQVWAEEKKPLWELGAGVAGITVPEYRGSNRQKEYVLPIPYLVYRGAFLKADRESVRGVFYKTSRVELNVSANANPPVGNDSSGAREGMPKLHPTFEIGPVLRWSLLRGAQSDLSLRFPLREVIAVDFPSTRHVGIVFNPSLVLDRRNFPSQGWSAGLSLGPRFADQSYNRYYYQVDPRYANSTRPAYSVKGGYGGGQVMATLSKRFERTWLGAFVSADYLSGAVFANSPLVEHKTAFMAGIGVSWIFGQSDKMVTVDE